MSQAGLCPRRRSILSALVCAALLSLASIGTAPSPAAADTLVPNLLKDSNPGEPGSTPTWFVQKGAEVFFLADSPTSGLWRTDGTTAGTVLVKETFFETTRQVVLLGTTLYYGSGQSGVWGTSGNELWKSDGTTAGTVLVKDVLPGPNGSQPTNLIAVGSTLFFTASTPDEGRELWKSDGTPAGTVLVKDILPGTGSSNPGTLVFSSAGGAKMIAYGNTLLFAATDGDNGGTANGVELWKSDGTPAGTVMVKEINPDCESLPGNSALNANPNHMVLFGGKVLFAATDGIFRCGPPASGLGSELWATDGTASGTVLVKNVNPADGASSIPSGLTVLNPTTALFSANNGTNGTELWKTNGTEAGTVLLKDINTTSATASSLSANALFGVAGGVASFGATDGTTGAFHGTELWKTDGTPDGTVLVKDINPGTAGSNPVFGSAAAVGNDLYFVASHPSSGTEPWKTDGTDAGTVLTRDINPGATGSAPSLLTAALGSVFFSADDGTTGREPWVTRTNQAVVGANDSYFAEQNTLLTIAAPGVLANDSDADGGILTAGSASDPPNGTVTLNPDGSFTYSPDAGFTGTDTFTYQASDGQGGIATQTVTLRVLGPTEVASVRGEACAYQVKVGLFGGGLGTSGCSELTGFPAAPRPPGPTPAPGSPAALDTSYSPHVVIPPSGGTVTATDPDGAAGRFGPAVIHGGMWPDDLDGAPPSGPQSASATGNLVAGTVTASADITLDGVPGSETPSDGPGGFGPFPVQGESLHVECSATKTAVTGSTTLVNATVTKATDGGGAPLPGATEAVPNNPPVNYTRHGVITNVGDVFTVVYNEHVWNDDGSLTVTAAHMYLFGPVAVGEVIRGQVTCGTTPGPAPPPDTQAPTCGTPVVQPVGPDDPTPQDPRTELVGVFDSGGLQSITNIRASNATVSVGRPPPAPAYLQFVPGQTGPLPITAQIVNSALPMFWSFDATDAAGNVIHCRGALAPPVAVDDTYAATAGTPLVIAAPGVLGNDTDPDGGPLTAGSPSTPANGTLVLNPDGSFTFTPDAGFTGDCVTYVVTDDTGLTDTGAVRITGGAAPVGCDDGYTTDEDTTLTVAAPGLLANDADADGDPLSIDDFIIFTEQLVAIFPNPDGSFSYTPNADFNGTDTFTYTVSDGTGSTDTATVTITMNAVDDAPVAEDDTATTTEETPVTVAAPGVLDNDTDAEGASLVASEPSNPAGGSVTLNPDGSYTYTPDANFSGTDTFTYTVSDGTLTDTGLVTITVTGTPDPSVAVDDAYTATEDTPLTVPAPGVLANDTDPDGGKTASAASDPANGTVTLSPDGSFTYTPDANFVGTDTFVYTVSGGAGAPDIGQVTISVNPANDAPVAVDDTATTTEDTPVTVPLPGVLGNDTDQEGDTLTAGSASNPAGGSVTLNANGSYTYTPDANFNGTDTFTYTVSDGNGGSDSGLVTVTVTAAADNPVAVDDAYTAAEDTALTVAAPGVLGNDTDPDGNPLTASGATTPANGTVTLNANGSFTYTPNPNFAGADTFSYTVNDGTARTDTGLVTITVNATNGSAFHPLTPVRILDSRPPPNQVGPFDTPWGPGATRDVTVIGAGVPAGADAVTLNVTVTGTTAPGFLTIWPKGQPQPVASSLNWAAGQTIPNAVTVKVGAAGQVSVFNAVGSANVIFDVVGYYDSILGDGYTPVDPTRILDSRPAPQQVGPFNTPWGAGETRNVAVTGGAIPPSADAVVLNVTVTGTTAPGFLTIWPFGQPKPLASSLNWAPGQTIPNAVTVKVGTGGSISVYNEIGSANVIIDVVGSFSAGSGSLFHPVTPARILDSRPAPNQVGPFSTPWGADTTRQVQVTGNGGIPANATAALLNVTVTNTTAPSFLTIWPAGAAAPTASSLNWAPGQTIPNAVTTKLPASGAISIRNAVGSVDVIADTAGWYG